MSKIPYTARNIGNFYLVYVTESLCSLCLDDVSKFILTLES